MVASIATAATSLGATTTRSAASGSWRLLAAAVRVASAGTATAPPRMLGG